MQSPRAVLYCHLWPAPLYNIFPHYLINGRILGGKILFNTKCLFGVSLQLLSETFFIPRSERDMIKMYIGLHVKCPLFLSDFNETWNPRQVLEKYPFHGNPSMGAELFHADKETRRSEKPLFSILRTSLKMSCFLQLLKIRADKIRIVS